MKSVDVKALPAPPSMVRALTSGFDSVANHVTVILFPIALDLFLWFGPHLGMQTLFKTMLQQMGTNFHTGPYFSMLLPSVSLAHA